MQFGIESVAAIAATQTGSPASAQIDATQFGASFPSMQSSTTQSASAPGAFADLMQGWVGEVNASAGAAETALRDLAAGKSVELHEVMITMERARLSVQTFVQIRNKLVESYQDLMRMQM